MSASTASDTTRTTIHGAMERHTTGGVNPLSGVMPGPPGLPIHLTFGPSAYPLPMSNPLSFLYGYGDGSAGSALAGTGREMGCGFPYPVYGPVALTTGPGILPGVGAAPTPYPGLAMLSAGYGLPLPPPPSVPTVPDPWSAHAAGWGVHGGASSTAPMSHMVGTAAVAYSPGEADAFMQCYQYSLAMQQQFVEQQLQQRLHQQSPPQAVGGPLLGLQEAPRREGGSVSSADTVASVSGSWNPALRPEGNGPRSSHHHHHQQQQQQRGGQPAVNAQAAEMPYGPARVGTAFTPPPRSALPPAAAAAAAAAAANLDSLLSEMGSSLGGSRLTPFSINHFADSNCLLCGGAGHTYSSCVMGDADLVCFFNEHDRHVYTMRHKDWVGEAVLADVVNFVETTLHIPRALCELWVDGRSLAALGGPAWQSMTLQPRDLRTPCRQLRILPGAVVFVAESGVWDGRRLCLTSAPREVSPAAVGGQGAADSPVSRRRLPALDPGRRLCAHGPPTVSPRAVPPTSAGDHAPPQVFLAAASHTPAQGVDQAKGQGSHHLSGSGGDEESGWQDGRGRGDGKGGARPGGPVMGHAPRVRLSPAENDERTGAARLAVGAAAIVGAGAGAGGGSPPELSGISTVSSAQLRSLPLPSLVAAAATTRAPTRAGPLPTPSAPTGTAGDGSADARPVRSPAPTATTSEEGTDWTYTSQAALSAQLLHVTLHPNAALMAEHTARARALERRNLQRYTSAACRRQRTLHIKFLPATMSFGDIRVLLAQFGEILKVRVICPQGPASTAAATGKSTTVVRDHDGDALESVEVRHACDGGQGQWLDRARIFLVAFVEYSCRPEALIARAALQGRRMGHGFTLSVSWAHQPITGGYRTDYDEPTGKPCTFGLTNDEIKTVNRAHGFVHWAGSGFLLWEQHQQQLVEGAEPAAWERMESPYHLPGTPAALAVSDAGGRACTPPEAPSLPRTPADALGEAGPGPGEAGAVVLLPSPLWPRAVDTPATASATSVGPACPRASVTVAREKDSPTALGAGAAVTVALPSPGQGYGGVRDPATLQARADAVLRFFAAATVTGREGGGRPATAAAASLTEWQWGPRQLRELLGLRAQLTVSAAQYATSASEPIFYLTLDVAHQILGFPGVYRPRVPPGEGEGDDAVAEPAPPPAPHPILLCLETLVYQAALWIYHDGHGDGVRALQSAQQALALVVGVAQCITQVQLLLGGVGSDAGGGAAARATLPHWRELFTSVPPSLQYTQRTMRAALQDCVLLPMSIPPAAAAEVGLTERQRTAVAAGEEGGGDGDGAVAAAGPAHGTPYPRVDAVYVMVERLLQLALLLDTYLSSSTDVLHSSREASSGSTRSTRHTVEAVERDVGLAAPGAAAPTAPTLTLSSPQRPDRPTAAIAGAAGVDARGGTPATNHDRTRSGSHTDASSGLEFEELRSVQRVKVELVSVATQLHRQLNDFNAAADLVVAVQRRWSDPDGADRDMDTGRLRQLPSPLSEDLLAAQRFWNALHCLMQERLPSCSAISVGIARSAPRKGGQARGSTTSDGALSTARAGQGVRGYPAGAGNLLDRLAPDTNQQYARMILENLAARSFLHC